MYGDVEALRKTGIKRFLYQAGVQNSAASHPVSAGAGSGWIFRASACELARDRGSSLLLLQLHDCIFVVHGALLVAGSGGALLPGLGAFAHVAASPACDRRCRAADRGNVHFPADDPFSPQRV